MNREIKFRGWVKKAQIMIQDLKIGSNRIPSNVHHVWEVMQYTGLKDRNGKEIYEGDVVKVEGDKPMVVEWSERFASFVLNRDGWMYSHWFGESCEPEKCEVVGNIYETPELLNNVLNVQGSDTTDVK